MADETSAAATPYSVESRVHEAKSNAVASPTPTAPRGDGEDGAQGPSETSRTADCALAFADDDDDDTFENGDGNDSDGSDIFAATSNSTENAARRRSATHQHPSDVPRLQAQHATAGYRDGIAAGRYETPAASARAFDEGWALGARVGARVGFVIAALEALQALDGLGQAPAASAAPEVPEAHEAAGEGRDASAAEATVPDRGMSREKEKAEKELDVLALLRGMQEAGLLGKGRGDARAAAGEGGAVRDEGRCEEDAEEWSASLETVLEKLPVLQKWMDRVRDMGASSGVDLTYPPDEER